MIALLSPAKSLDLSPTDQISQTTPLLFPEQADYLASKLKKFSSKKLGKMMNLSQSLADLNFERYQKWNVAGVDNEQKQALLSFTGDVYRGMGASDFDEKELMYAQQHVLMLSGLYGLLRPLDLMQPYRLEMGTRWEITKKFKNLYAYWSDTIAEYLNANADGLLINLASTEYFKAVDGQQFEGDIITCQFMDLKGDQYKVVMTWAKLARGMMARFMIQNQVKDVEELKEFTTGGYAFNEAMSSEHEWVFTRDTPQ